MLTIPRVLRKSVKNQLICRFTSSTTKSESTEEFRVLNIRRVKSQPFQRRPPKKSEVLQPRHEQMSVDQTWSDVWPGPRSFHPATVPLPLRQGYVEKGTPPDKYGNAELMKIPNFLHLTPPAIKKQCEALKQFCTPWPQNLDEKLQEKLFPVEVTSSNYCHSSPSIRDPLARIVTVRFPLKMLQLDERARDKFLRLVGDKYNEKNGMVTFVADRCPLRKQNYDYAMYLLTACFHESWNKEPWEDLKSEADMEYYEWKNSVSKKNVETLFNKPSEEIPNVEEYAKSISNLMNEGESEYTLKIYGDSVRKLLGLKLAEET